jgi:hypothetical protein
VCSDISVIFDVTFTGDKITNSVLTDDIPMDHRVVLYFTKRKQKFRIFRRTISYITSRSPNVVVEWFVFRRSRVQMSAWKPAIVTEGFGNFSQSLHANAEIIPVN